MPVRKSPFTNTCKSPLFCMRKVNISLLFTEDLQNGEILGEICIKFRIDREIISGIYYDILERRGVAAVGVRAADWPRSAPQEVTLPRPKFE